MKNYCGECESECVFHEYTTFSYWWCPACKTEVLPPNPPPGLPRSDDYKPMTQEELDAVWDKLYGVGP